MTKKPIINFFITVLTLTLVLTAFSCSTSESETPTNSEQEKTTESKQDNTQTDNSPSNNSLSTNEMPPDSLHVVIYGIGIQGKGIDKDGNVSSDSNNRFAILYNQTEEDVNIGKWKIKKAAFNDKSDSAEYKSTFDIPKDTTIKSKHYLLLTRSGYNPDFWNGDVTSDVSIKEGNLIFATNGNHIALVDADDEVIDRLDYIALSAQKQKTWERKYNELYINTDTAFIFRKDPDTDTNINYEDFTSKAFYEEFELRNSTTVTK